MSEHFTRNVAHRLHALPTIPVQTTPDPSRLLARTHLTHVRVASGSPKIDVGVLNPSETEMTSSFFFKTSVVTALGSGRIRAEAETMSCESDGDLRMISVESDEEVRSRTLYVRTREVSRTTQFAGHPRGHWSRIRVRPTPDGKLKWLLEKHPPPPRRHICRPQISERGENHLPTTDQPTPPSPAAPRGAPLCRRVGSSTELEFGQEGSPIFLNLPRESCIETWLDEIKEESVNASGEQRKVVLFVDVDTHVNASHFGCQIWKDSEAEPGLTVQWTNAMIRTNK